MSVEFIDLLRSANKWLSGCLDRMSSRQPGELPTTGAELQTLSGLIERVGEAWRSAPPSGNLAQERGAEIAQYAENLRSLKSLLEGLQPELQQRRADLHAGLTKLQAALGWATTLKQTRED